MGNARKVGGENENVKGTISVQIFLVLFCTRPHKLHHHKYFHFNANSNNNIGVAVLFVSPLHIVILHKKEQQSKTTIKTTTW